MRVQAVKVYLLLYPVQGQPLLECGVLVEVYLQAWVKLFVTGLTIAMRYSLFACFYQGIFYHVIQQGVGYRVLTKIFSDAQAV